MSQASDAPALPYPIPVPAGSALEPPAEWARLRQDRPMAPVVLPSGDGAALVTRYADVKQVLADPRCTRVLSADDAARLTDSESGGVFNSEVAATLSDAGHARWRRMLSRWFTAKRMTALRPGIEAMADQLIDGMVADGAPADLSAHLGFPLPVWVICDMLGVPTRDRDKFAHWSHAFLNLTQFSQAETDSAQAAFMGYLAGHIATKRAQPTDDLLSDLITGTDADGGRLSEMELLATGQALLVAGHETTSGMIGKMVAMLLADRRRWEQLVADPSLVRPAVEEALRFDANPGFGMPRYLREEIQTGSGTLARGTTVVCSMAAANRDATAFEAADEMDLTRSPNPHLAFGVGPHSCLGQSLARTELQVVLEVLLRRLPTLELAVDAGDLRRVEGLVVGRLQEVPVRW
jgi:cytochrome P450